MKRYPAPGDAEQTGAEVVVAQRVLATQIHSGARGGIDKEEFRRRGNGRMNLAAGELEPVLIRTRCYYAHAGVGRHIHRADCAYFDFRAGMRIGFQPLARSDLAGTTAVEPNDLPQRAPRM
ncbi:MAG TPA: hypothetical protein VGL82_04900 [Bryobacteraceae bacterium]